VLARLTVAKRSGPLVRVVGTRTLRGSSTFLAAALAVPIALALAFAAATALERDRRRMENS
jgi:hypothetical protein